MAKKITYMGVSRSLKQWSEEWEIPYGTLQKRLRRNPDISLDALFSKDLHEHKTQREIISQKRQAEARMRYYGR